MIKHPHQTPSESAADQKERERRMRRYDAHMNKHGHYSMLAKPNQGRSAILDQILRSGGTLQSDYLERMGPPPDLEIVNAEMPEKLTEAKLTLEKLTAELADLKRDDPAYMKTYMAMKRAERAVQNDAGTAPP